MNQYPGVIGKKLGMTQVFNEDGSVIPCTVVQAQPFVVGKRTQEKDGYDALVLGLGERKEKHVRKPQVGHFKKTGVSAPKTTRELRCSAEWIGEQELGQPLSLDKVFEAGQMVDVQSVSRGRGFTGVMRRYNFKGAVSTHGSHEYKRHGGSIGTNMTPGRVWPGKKMPGQSGNVTVSVLNQPVVKVIPEQGLILIRGGIPGARNSLVMVRGAVKRRGGKPAK